MEVCLLLRTALLALWLAIACYAAFAACAAAEREPAR